MELNRIKMLFVNRRAQIRLGWLSLIAAGMYGLAAIGIYELYWYLYRTMMGIWCVTSENISRAPEAVQFLYSWSNVIVQLLQNALLVGFAVCFARLGGLDQEEAGLKKGFVKGAGIGAGCVAAIWCVLMLTGSVRQGWRMSRPDFSINTLALLITTFSASLAEGCFLYGAVYGMIKKRLPMWAALAIVMALNAFLMGNMLPTALVNGMLIALICCLLSERYGLCAAVGFRFAWSYLDQAVFGFAGSTAALFETYPVNLYWLSGGNAGILSGALASAALLAIAYLLIGKTGLIRLPKWKKRSKSPS